MGLVDVILSSAMFDSMFVFHRLDAGVRRFPAGSSTPSRSDLDMRLLRGLVHLVCWPLLLERDPMLKAFYQMPHHTYGKWRELGPLLLLVLL